MTAAPKPTPEDLLVLGKALVIGQISYDGDGWYASRDALGDRGYGYDEAEQAFEDAFAVLRRLAGEDR